MRTKDNDCLFKSAQKYVDSYSKRQFLKGYDGYQYAPSTAFLGYILLRSATEISYCMRRNNFLAEVSLSADFQPLKDNERTQFDDSLLVNYAQQIISQRQATENRD